MITLSVTTAAGTNASKIGERYAIDGTSWRNSVDRCDSDGHGRVFIDCEDEDTADAVCEMMEGDEDVIIVR